MSNEVKECYITELVIFLKKFRGQERAIKTREIEYDFENGKFKRKSYDEVGVNKRWMRRVINAARMAGHPILGTGDGYCMASDQDELDYAMNRLTKVAQEMIKSASKISETNIEEYWEVKENEC